MLVNYEDADLAAEEIHRLGDHDGFVQVLLVARTSEPLGRRKYWKMYEAALEYDLPIGIHFGGSGGHPLTAAGGPPTTSKITAVCPKLSRRRSPALCARVSLSISLNYAL